MATLDSSIVNIALPTLTKELGHPLQQVRWVVLSYLLVITCLLLPFGKLADLLGRKRVYLWGYFIFTAGSILCGISSSLVWLITFRVIQGIGAAMLMANGPAIITRSVPTQELGAALGTMGMVVSSGLIAGPAIGGILITHFGWPSIFFLNIPVGILGMLLVSRYVPYEEAVSKVSEFDWPGAIIQTFALLSLMVLFEPPDIRLEGTQHLPVSRVLISAFTFVFVFLLVKVEKKADDPLLDFGLLRIRDFWTANLASFLTFIAFSSVTVLMPFFLEEIKKFTPDQAGYFMTAIPLTLFVVAPLSGHFSDKYGSKGLSSLGSIVSMISFFAMAGLFGLGIHAGITDAMIFILLSAIGLSLGLFQSPNNSMIMSSVPHESLGTASALLATVRNLGLVIGTGLSTTIFAWKKHETGDFIESLHFSHGVSGVVALCAVFVSLAKANRKPMHESFR